VAYATGVKEHVSSVATFTGTTTPAVSEVNAASRRSVLVSFAFDGFAIYDNVSMNGHVVPVSAFDACNGITSPVPGYPHGIDHYVLENVKGAVFDRVLSRSRVIGLHPSTAARSRCGAVPSLAGVTTVKSLAAIANEDAYLEAMLALDQRAQC
jgi:hypothetical protein